MFENTWFERGGRLALGLCGTALLVWDSYPHFRDGRYVCLALVEALAALFCLGFAIGLKPWSATAWALRGLLAVLGYCVYEGHNVWRVDDWIALSCLVGLALVGQHIAHRHALGWIVDAQGERQKVEHFNRGNAVYKPTTHAERIALEATLTAKRRRTMVLAALLGGIPAFCAWYMLGTSYSTLALVAGLIGAPFLLVAAWELLVEAAYLWGNQDMRGAKVLDAAPVKPGLIDIEGEKVHGDAPFASEDEALHFLQPQG
jgi:hypothetical protein